MITFLPVPDFQEVAQLLDNKRLGAQRVEARFILRCVRNVGGRYIRFLNTGYVRMWVGFVEALAIYYNAIHAEWLRRGFKEGISKVEQGVAGLEQGDVDLPEWLGDQRLHATHRAALLCKDADHYGRFGWTEVPQVEYLWPQRRDDGGWDLVAPVGGKSQPSAAKRMAEAEAATSPDGNPQKRRRRVAFDSTPDGARRHQWNKRVNPMPVFDLVEDSVVFMRRLVRRGKRKGNFGNDVVEKVVSGTHRTSGTSGKQITMEPLSNRFPKLQQGLAVAIEL